MEGAERNGKNEIARAERFSEGIDKEWVLSAIDRM